MKIDEYAILADILLEQHIKSDSTLHKLLSMYTYGGLRQHKATADDADKLTRVLYAYGLIGSDGGVTTTGKALLRGAAVKVDLSKYKYLAGLPKPADDDIYVTVKSLMN